MFVKSLFAFAACGRFAFAAPTPQGATSVVLARAADISTCPGYTATNINVNDAGLTADLSLAGTACNAYSEDLQELKLTVEHQTGMCQYFLSLQYHERIFQFRHSTSNTHCR